MEKSYHYPLFNALDICKLQWLNVMEAHLDQYNCQLETAEVGEAIKPRMEWNEMEPEVIDTSDQKCSMHVHWILRGMHQF